jgi:hypothetical protein
VRAIDDAGFRGEREPINGFSEAFDYLPQLALSRVRRRFVALVGTARVRFTILDIGARWGAAGREKPKTSAKRREALPVDHEAEMSHRATDNPSIACAARVVGRWDETR